MTRGTARALIVSHLPRYAIVMAGGAGTRFWPRSRIQTPKQLLALRGGRSLLQETVARVSPPIRRDRVLVVTARAHARAVARQLRQLGRRAVLAEPAGRNTAAAIARGLAAASRRLPAVSIDHGVLERAERVAVVRARFGWSDVGSWAAVAALWSGGNGDNAVRGRALSIDSRGCLVDSPERLVAVLGVEDLVVVDTRDAVLVCRKDRAQDVRLVVDELRRRGLRRYL